MEEKEYAHEIDPLNTKIPKKYNKECCEDKSGVYSRERWRTNSPQRRARLTNHLHASQKPQEYI